MPLNNSKKSDRKEKGKANASTSASTSTSRVLAGYVLPCEIAPINTNIEGVKSDIAIINTNMTTFKNKLGVLVGMSGKTNMAYVEFAKAYANDQVCIASVGSSLMTYSALPPSLSDAETTAVILAALWRFFAKYPLCPPGV
ncbi:hypothetical protein PHYBLDRAFT_152786 [Phycomyces blakesleeanus NRRL 1555(-)]|uniref:Uncharacterized protein n=1 Tax=Phycomyces blakesleeanus (strain ATCC 8743b / DSM 1359 / FGSC 10004 / NBRC 33097 / NRRL 1555) TaxID=763407 RepID=A0A162TD95_PHYB8|nr:hypothetical protein PHYBLDRAFT_152786 [Phycomyces blakesleeanus NRRL 1555(-)]OAD66213.1 hypothetical protein PHYBLDRAFT_152786 [Phycomyces blakesleeanus NRRL 1555(-)]|eukprot:XP_018284253.1 hypothetical protein PHYBLDRAFT_152786 [Phycomyces blakesleeanus NRRL 1555(-)]